MSLSALLTAVRDHLRQSIPLKEHECEIQIDGQPVPGCGNRYVAVHSLGWENMTEENTFLGERYSIGVTITQRYEAIPRDRIPTEVYLKALTGIEALSRKIMVAMIHDYGYTVINLASTFIEGEDKFYEPLRWSGNTSAPIPRESDWFWSDEPGFAGLSLELTFRNAIRIQSQDIAE